MKNKRVISLTLIACLFGFMLAVQFNSKNQPEPRDTRGTWELREDFLEAKQLETELIKEIRKVEEKLAQYQTEQIHSKEQIFYETLNELKMDAGLEDIEGHGLIITLNPAYSNLYPGAENPYVSPDVIRKLINELNMYGAIAISIADQRIIHTSVVREIQGTTRIDGYPLNQFPIEIKVVAKDAETTNKLYNRMQISKIPDDFFIDNISFTISEPQKNLIVPAYTGEIRTDEMAAIQQGGN